MLALGGFPFVLGSMKRSNQTLTFICDKHNHAESGLGFGASAPTSAKLITSHCLPVLKTQRPLPGARAFSQIVRGCCVDFVAAVFPLLHFIIRGCASLSAHPAYIDYIV